LSAVQDGNGEIGDARRASAQSGPLGKMSMLLEIEATSFHPSLCRGCAKKELEEAKD
jgi:hypothetical protein